MVKVFLHGHLKDRFGGEFQFAAKTASECLAALAVNLDGFLSVLKEVDAYAFVVETDDGDLSLQEYQLDTMLLPGPLHIVPRVCGDQGYEAYLIYLAISVAVSAISIGVSMLLAPKVEAYDSGEGKKSHFLFNSAINRTEQGGPIPIAYGGPLLVGSVVVSSGIDIEEVLKRSPSQKYGTNSVLRVVDIISEGPIAGLREAVDSGNPADAAKSVFLENTRLMALDGELNFDGVTVNQRLGDHTQTPVAGFPMGEAEVPVGVKIEQATPVVRTIDAGAIDDMRIKIRIPALYISANTGLEAGKVELQFEIKRSVSPEYTDLGTVTVKLLTTSAYEKVFRIEDISQYGEGPWDVRVTRVTRDYDGSKVKGDTYWQSYTRIVNDQFVMPDTAYITSEVNAKDFGEQVPGRGFEIYGRNTIKIPSNYNPWTRTYSGVWDGTFVEDWTNNPAWILNDICINPRYGLGEGPVNACGMAQDNVNKWALYAIAKKCDDLLPDGAGGWEPRFTFNYCLTTREESYSVLRSFMSAFTTICHYSSGSLNPVIDLDDDVSHIASPANVIDGTFEYSGQSLKDIKTAAIITWNDPADDYRPALEVYEDKELIAAYGWNPLEIMHVGCTSQSQARRFGAYHIESQKSGDGIVFKGGSYFSDCQPGSVIEIHDPFYDGAETHARVISATASTILLDRLLPLDPSETYYVSVTLPESQAESSGEDTDSTITPAITVKQVASFASLQYLTDGAGNYITDGAGNPITNARYEEDYLTDAAGNYITDALGNRISTVDVLSTVGTTLTLTTPFTTNPMAGAFVGLASGSYSPRKFRVTKLQEIEPHRYEISGKYHDPDRYDRIYGDIIIEATEGGTLPTGPLPAIDPATVEVENYSYAEGNNWLFGVAIGWGDVVDARLTGYEVERSIAGDSAYEPVQYVRLSSVTVTPTTAGTWDFRIRAVDRYRGNIGPWMVLEDVITVDASNAVPDVTGLEAKGGGTSFDDDALDIVWDDAEAPDDYYPASRHKDYVVEFRDPATHAALRVAYPKREAYRYTKQMIRKDFGSVSAGVEVAVKARDVNGNVSINWCVVTFSRSLPSMAGFSPTVEARTIGVTLDWSAWSHDKDPDKFYIYCDNSNPPTTLVCKTSGRATQRRIPKKVTKNQVWYAQVVPVDDFGLGIGSNVVSSTGDDDLDAAWNRSGRGGNRVPAKYSSFDARKLPPVSAANATVTLGAAGSGYMSDRCLVLTTNAGVSEGYVYLGSGYNIKIQPGLKWLISSMVRGGQYQQGSLYLQTSDGNHHEVPFTLPRANEYDLMAGVIDLTSNASKKARIRLDANGANYQFNFDTIQLEPYTGDGTVLTPSSFTGGDFGDGAIASDMIEDDGASVDTRASSASYNIVSAGASVVILETGDIEVLAQDKLRINAKVGSFEGKAWIALFEYIGGSWVGRDGTRIATASQGGSCHYQRRASADDTVRYQIQAYSDSLDNNLAEDISIEVIRTRR